MMYARVTHDDIYQALLFSGTNFPAVISRDIRLLDGCTDDDAYASIVAESAVLLILSRRYIEFFDPDTDCSKISLKIKRLYNEVKKHEIVY